MRLATPQVLSCCLLRILKAYALATIGSPENEPFARTRVDIVHPGKCTIDINSQKKVPLRAKVSKGKYGLHVHHRWRFLDRGPMRSSLGCSCILVKVQVCLVFPGIREDSSFREDGKCTIPSCRPMLMLLIRRLLISQNHHEAYIPPTCYSWSRKYCLFDRESAE